MVVRVDPAEDCPECDRCGECAAVVEGHGYRPPGVPVGRGGRGRRRRMRPRKSFIPTAASEVGAQYRRGLRHRCMVVTLPRSDDLPAAGGSGCSAYPSGLLVAPVVMGEPLGLAVGVDDLVHQLEHVGRGAEPLASVGAAAGELPMPLRL